MNDCPAAGKWIFSCLLFFALSDVALADTPLPPAEAKVCSASGRYCLHGPPLQQNLTMFRMERGQATPLWTAPGEAARYIVAEDGEHYVRIPPGLNMLSLQPGQADPQRILFVFYARDQELSRITLGQLIRNISRLPRSVSHLVWARDFRFAPDGKFVIRTVEERTLVFDPTTGVLISERAE